MSCVPSSSRTGVAISRLNDTSGTNAYDLILDSLRDSIEVRSLATVLFTVPDHSHFVHAQAWSGILDTSRAIDWSQQRSWRNPHESHEDLRHDCAEGTKAVRLPKRHQQSDCLLSCWGVVLLQAGRFILMVQSSLMAKNNEPFAEPEPSDVSVLFCQLEWSDIAWKH